MLQVNINPNQPLAHDACGKQARLIETRGRLVSNPRLIGQKCRQFNVECAACGVSTRPVYSQRIAENLWRYGDHLPIAALPALRLRAEQDLAHTVANATAA